MAQSSSSEYCCAPAGPGVGHDPARGAHLDELGAVLDLVADGFAHLAHAVGDALLDGEGEDVWREGLEHGRVEMAAGRRNGVSGRDHSGAVHPSEVDGLLEGDVEQKPSGLDEETEVPHRRESRSQGAPGVGHGTEDPNGRVVLHRVEGTAMVRSTEEKVDLHVHEPGQEGDVAQVEDLGIGGNGGRDEAPRCGRRGPGRHPARRRRRPSTSSIRALRRWVGGGVPVGLMAPPCATGRGAGLAGRRRTSLCIMPLFH